MKPSTLLHLLSTAAVASATYMCPVSPSSNDAPAVLFSYVLQNLLSSYYESMLINASFFSSLPSPTKLMTDFLANTMGLAVQAKLSEDALSQVSMAVRVTKPNCNLSYPPVTNTASHLMNAFILEATLCGAFISLAEYVQSPQAAFLMARLAAEHGIHASYIGSHMQPVLFPANSTSLTVAFTPEMVSMKGMGVGPLGDYLNGCVMPLAALRPQTSCGKPRICGGTVEIGMLRAMLNSKSSSNMVSTNGAGTESPTSPSSSP